MNTHDYFFYCVSVARKKGQTLFLDSDATCLVCRMSIGSHSLEEFEKCAFQYYMKEGK